MSAATVCCVPLLSTVHRKGGPVGGWWHSPSHRINRAGFGGSDGDGRCGTAAVVCDLHDDRLLAARGGAGDRPAELAAHLTRSRQLHTDGALLMAGAFLDRPEEPLQTMGVLASREAAEDCARHDPFVRGRMVSDWTIRQVGQHARLINLLSGRSCWVVANTAARAAGSGHATEVVAGGPPGRDQVGRLVVPAFRAERAGFGCPGRRRRRWTRRRWRKTARGWRGRR
jgi:uncharacterized protein YciI